jgi:hypothetical protein
MTSVADSPELTIVVAIAEDAEMVSECIAALRRACDRIDTEILVVDASPDHVGASRCVEYPEVRILTMPEGTLVPLLWGAGLREARGSVVAFTIGQCVVEQGWARAMLDGIASGAAGAGGRFDLQRGSGATVRATFYLRYSAWLALPSGPAREIAGDNAAYDRASLRAVERKHDTGFWEVDVHARFRELGKGLALVDGATARFGGKISLRAMAGRRFAHGRHSGAFRVEQGIRTRWQMVLGAPLVPAVLLLRVARRVARVPAHWWSFLTSLGAFIVLATAWAMGEAIGAWTALPTRREALRAA